MPTMTFKKDAIDNFIYNQIGNTGNPKNRKVHLPTESYDNNSRNVHRIDNTNNHIFNIYLEHAIKHMKKNNNPDINEIIAYMMEHQAEIMQEYSKSLKA